MSFSLHRMEPMKKCAKITSSSSSSEPSRLIQLPEELLMYIAKYVGSVDVEDLVNLCKTCVKCRFLCRDSTVLRSVDMNKFTLDQWDPMSEEKETFFNLCVRNGNPDAMFRKGMFLFFKYLHTGVAETNLIIRSAEEGHRPAIYAICLIHLSGIYTFTSDMLSKLQYTDCLQLFQFLRNEKCVVECRKAIWAFFCNKTFITNPAVESRNTLCIGRKCKNLWRPADGKWFFIEEEDDLNLPNDCLRCRIDHEFGWFQNIIERRHSNWGSLAWKHQPLDFDMLRWG